MVVVGFIRTKNISNNNKSSRKNLKRKLPTEFEETFDFQTLPNVCQRRFAEICDPKTLKTFASINSLTKELVKRCHIVDKAILELLDSYLFFIVSCFCDPNEFCENANRYSFQGKIEVMEEIAINNLEKKLNFIMIQNLPINFASTKSLKVFVRSAELKALSAVGISPNLKSFSFKGGLHSKCTVEEFVDFIQSLSKMSFILDINLENLPFDLEDLRKYLDSFNFVDQIAIVDRNYIFFTKKL